MHTSVRIWRISTSRWTTEMNQRTRCYVVYGVVCVVAEQLEDLQDVMDIVITDFS